MSIGVFGEHFTEIVRQLENLAEAGNAKTKQTAYQLLCASRTAIFVVCLFVIQKYSSKLESVTQKLQAVQLDLLGAQAAIKDHLVAIRADRNNCDERYSDIFIATKNLADEIGLDLKPPRQAQRQINRANPQIEDPEQYFKVTVYIPYLDSLVSSLETRFTEENKPAYSLLSLHPYRMAKLNRNEFKEHAKSTADLYKIENFLEESESWYDVWLNRKRDGMIIAEDITLTEVLSHTEFYPSVRMALQIALALPVTTCTIERSFSTLRRVKTWIRSTTSDDRLSGLCMMSVHRKKNSENKDKFIETVINQFGQEPRRLQLLFQEQE